MVHSYTKSSPWFRQPETSLIGSSFLSETSISHTLRIISRQLERPPKKPRKFGTVKRANHSVCFITAQLLAGANEKWPCIQLYQISLFSVKNRVRSGYEITFSLLDSVGGPLLFKGTGSRFSACLLIKMLFFCRHRMMLYRL